MFLALNEIRYEKLRYGLVTSLIFLIAFLVFFLTGLAYGLAQENRMAVDKWEADYILLDESADEKLNLSRFNPELIDEVEADHKALLNQSAAIARMVVEGEDGEEEETAGITFFSIDFDSFLAPELVEGDYPAADDEVVADISFKEDYDYQIGDPIDISTADKEVTISGFTDKARYSVGPVLYINLPGYNQVVMEAEESEAPAIANAIVVRGEVENLPDELSQVPIADFIEALPGYAAQNLTFTFMIGFLVLITAVVIGIFMYVLTMQKASIFGVMKAQGISSGYIIRSVLAQTGILATAGVALALLFTIGASFVLPNAVPFINQPVFLAVMSLAIIIISLISALFSVRSIVKIDPLDSIS